MKKRNVLVALLSVAMVAVLLFSAVPVSAATQSNGTKQVTIKVWTKGS